MSTRKIIAAVVSVAILGSSLAVFQSSSRSYMHRVAVASPALHDQRPVTRLAPVVVYAEPVLAAKVATLDTGSTQADVSLWTSGNRIFGLGSQLGMPYYSFASNLNTLIKE